MVILSLLIGMIKHSQITQSNKFAISFQHLEKMLMYGVHFFICRLTLEFLQVGIIVFDGNNQMKIENW